MTNDDPLTDDELESRIEAQSDESFTAHAIYKTGKEDFIEYYLVVGTKMYEGDEKLVIRYFALHANNTDADTWMKNGINCRDGPTVLERLATDLPGINALTKSGADASAATITHDLTDESE